jgi:hypothetical protein
MAREFDRANHDRNLLRNSSSPSVKWGKVE